MVFSSGLTGACEEGRAEMLRGRGEEVRPL